MNITKTIIILIVSFYCQLVYAQTIQGYVKTKGRIENGKNIPGKGIAGVTIKVKFKNHYTNPVLTIKDGSFYLTIPQMKEGDTFTIEQISKSGYVLIDKELLNKPIAYSSYSPLFIVMEEATRLQEDRLNIEKKLRSNLLKQLRQREEEIDALNVDEDEKNRMLHQLYKQHEDNERLINDIAQKYLAKDPDSASEYDLKLSELILEGDLGKADSLINFKRRISDKVNNIKSEQHLALDSLKLQLDNQISELKDDLYNKYFVYKNKEKTDSAIYYLELRARIDSTSYQLLTETGDILLEDFSYYIKALEYYNKALIVAIDVNGGNHVDVASLYYRIASINQIMGVYTTAVDYYKKAISIFKEVQGSDKLLLAGCYTNIGIVCNSFGNNEVALNYMKSALQIKEKMLGKNHPDVANAYNNVGWSYYSIGDNLSALLAMEMSLNILEGLYGKVYPDVAISYFNIGHITYKMENYSVAIKYYKTALGICEKLGDDVIDSLMIHQCIGNSLYKMQQYDEALLEYDVVINGSNRKSEIISEATENIKKILYDNYKLHLSHNERDSASVLLERRAQIGKSDCLLLIETGTLFLEDLSNDKKAYEYYKMAYGIAITENSGINLDVAQSYYNIGKVYEFQCNYHLAIEEAKKALNLQKEILGGNAKDVGQSTLFIGNLYNSMNEFTKAIEYFNCALEIFNDLYKNGYSEEIAATYNSMGATYENKKDTTNALKYYMDALNMRKKLYDYDNKDIAASYSNIAGIFAIMNDNEQSIEYYNKSIDIYKKVSGVKSRDVAYVYNNLAETYYNMDDYINAKSYYEQSLEILMNSLPSDHPDIKTVKQNIVNLKTYLK